MIDLSQNLSQNVVFENLFYSRNSFAMARTKGDGGAARSVGAKAPRKALGGGSSGAASRAISASASPRGGGGGGAGYNPLGQPVPGWQKPMTSFFKMDPNAPSVKRKDDEKQVKETEKEDEDEENEPPLKKEKESPKDEVKEVKKNGIIDDSDDDE